MKWTDVNNDSSVGTSTTVRTVFGVYYNDDESSISDLNLILAVDSWVATEGVDLG